MKHRKPGVQRKLTVLILSVCLVLMMMDTCPVRSFLQNALPAPVETAALNYQVPCSDIQITETDLFCFSSSSAHHPLSPGAALSGLYLVSSPVFFQPKLPDKRRAITGISRVPLFLANRSIII